MGGFIAEDPSFSFRDSSIVSDRPGVVRSSVSSIILARSPPIAQWNQDCVAVSAADCYLFELLSAGLVPEPERLFVEPSYYEEWLPSRRKLYWDARAVSGTERVDGGTRPSALARAVSEKGVCAERWCPYTGAPEENPLADNDDAGRMAMDQAGRIELFECADFDAVIATLASGHRVLYASAVYESMQHVDADEFYVPSGPRLGLHMWQLVGFERGGSVIRMKNQWPGWGGQRQEAFAQRSTLEAAMLTALAFRRTSVYSEQT
jgi:hypothetical protein